MSEDADYEDADVHSEDEEVEDDEDASHEESADDEGAEEDEEGQEEETEDFDALDDTAPPKALPRTITLLLPRPQKPGEAAAALEPTCVHVCLTRGLMGRLPKPPKGATAGDEEEEEEDENEADSSRDASAHGNAAAVARNEEEENEEDDDAAATTAARLQGCCAEGHHYQLDYAAPLAAQRRRIILRHLHGDAERQRRFLLAERQREAKAGRAGGKGENDDGGDDGAADGDGGAAGGEASGADDEEGAAAGGAVDNVVWPWTSARKPPPYWLPALLSNDAQTLQRVLHIMYGWVIAPDPHPADHLKLDAAGRLGTGTPNPEEDDEDVEQADPAHHNPDFFLASGAFRGEEDEEEAGGGGENEDGDSNTSSNRESAAPADAAAKSLMGAFNDADGDGGGDGDDEDDEEDDAPHHSDEDTATQHADAATVNGLGRSRALLSTVTAPPPVVELPYFPFAEYEFFIAYDEVSEEWHLLDTHPMYVMQACRRRRADEGGAAGRAADADADADDAGDDNSDNADDSDAEEGDETAEKAVSGAFPVPKYALDALVPVSPVVLAALFSPAALRCCLLQPLHDAKDAEGDGEEASEEDEDGGKAAAPKRGVDPRAVLRSFDESWLAVDVSVAVPILATICRVRQRVLQQDTARIPYALGNLWLDVNPLLMQPGFAAVTLMASAEEVLRWRAPPGQSAEEAEDLEDAAAAAFGVSVPNSPVLAQPELATPHRWGDALDSLVDPNHYGRLVLAALLDAGVLPTRPVEASLFADLGQVRLVLWWWMRLPAKLIRQWGISAADAEAAAAGDDDGDGAPGQDEEAEGEEDDEAGVEAEMETMTTEDVSDFIRQQVEKMTGQAADVRRRQLRKQHPTLRLAPLLQRVVLELQRRLDRAKAVDTRGAAVAPSQYTLQESVAHTFAADRLESGRPRQDPLVTSTFVGMGKPVEHLTAAGDSTHVPGAASAAVGLVRHQRLYQSDLVLLLLALTSTPAPPPSRATVMLELTEKRFSSVTETSSTFEEGAGAVDNIKEAELRDMDGHLGLFAQLLEAKSMRCVRRPQDRARSGTVKLLLLCAADFSRGATRHCFFNQLPAFELFGSTGYCPLQELVHAWACACSSRPDTGDARKKTATMELFAYFTWNEVRWRLCKGQYKDADVARMREQLPDLFALVESHTSTYGAILAHLDAEATSGSELDGNASEALSLAESMTMGGAGPAAGKGLRQRPSLVSSALLRAARDEERDAADITHTNAAASRSLNSTPPPAPSSSFKPVGGAPDGATSSAGAGTRVSRPLTLAHPNAYSADVLDAKMAVSELWASFQVASRTYMTAETLHALLFGRDRSGDADEEDDGGGAVAEARRFHLAALRVMLEHGVTTVQACPLEGTEVPAMEAALQRADLAAVKILLGLGAASLQDTRLHGSATLESWAETLFSPADMAVLRFVAQRNGKAVRADPRLQFGARRFNNALAQS